MSQSPSKHASESGPGSDASEIIRDLLKVLHPGAVGLITNNHGEDRGVEACNAIDSAKSYLNRAAMGDVLPGQ